MKNIRYVSALYLFFVAPVLSMENFVRLGADRSQWHRQVLWDAATGPGEFQVSYKGQDIKLDGRSDGYLISTVPALGFYRRSIPYLFRTRCLLLQFDPIASWDYLPPSVQRVLTSVRLGTRSSIRAVIAVHEKLKYADGDDVAKASRLVNLLYHSWVGEVLGKERNFKINLPMGIFEFDGIESYAPPKFDIPHDYAKKRRHGADAHFAIPFGRLGNQTVHEHNAYSPDNARFVITAGSNIATFWSVAVYPGSTHALVAFHVLINGEDEAELICNQAIRSASTMKEILQRLYDAVLPALTGKDKETLRKAIIIIRDLIGGTYPAWLIEPPVSYTPKEPDISALMYSLGQLQQSLCQLHKILVF